MAAAAVSLGAARTARSLVTGRDLVTGHA